MRRRWSMRLAGAILICLLAVGCVKPLFPDKELQGTWDDILATMRGGRVDEVRRLSTGAGFAALTNPVFTGGEDLARVFRRWGAEWPNERWRLMAISADYALTARGENGPHGPVGGNFEFIRTNGVWRLSNWLH